MFAWHVPCVLRAPRSVCHSPVVSPSFSNGNHQIIQVSMATEFSTSSSGSLGSFPWQTLQCFVHNRRQSFHRSLQKLVPNLIGIWVFSLICACSSFLSFLLISKGMEYLLGVKHSAMSAKKCKLQFLLCKALKKSCHIYTNHSTRRYTVVQTTRLMGLQRGSCSSGYIDQRRLPQGGGLSYLPSINWSKFSLWCT